MSEANKYIVNYLDFYLENGNAKNYAVLLDGDWGSGKTYFIKRFFGNETRKKKYKFLYISLYGVSKVSEIDDQIFQQLHPILSNKYVSIATRVIKGAVKIGAKIDLGAGSGSEVSGDLTIPNATLKDFIKDASDAVLVFDDLERCSVPVEKMLGYINYFCEHQNHRVIVIANEKEIPKNKKYYEIKEKLVGRTLAVTSNAEEALETFINFLADQNAKDFLNKNKDLVLTLYRASGYQNLRSLKQAIVEWPQIFQYLPPKAQNHEELLREMLTTLLVLSFEIRKGAIKIEKLEDLSRLGYSYALTKKKDEVNSYAEVEKKYTKFSFGQICPNNSCWYSFFKDGSIPQEALYASIEESRFFRDENIPDWHKLLYFSELTEQEFETLLKQVRNNFVDGKYKKFGEIKHVVSTLIYFSENKMISETSRQVLAWSKKIIKKMEDNKELLYEKHIKFGPHDAYAGVIFLSNDNPDFKSVVRYLESLYRRDQERGCKHKAIELISLVEKDSNAFWEALSNRGGSDRRYHEMPVFKFVKPDLFVQAFLKCPNDKKMNISYGFKDRYQYIASNSVLLEELSWLRSVKRLMDKEVRKAGPITRYQIKRFLNYSVLTAIENMSALLESQVDP